MSSPHDHSSSDRNLLFGILALQMNFITRDHLVEGMHAWVLDKMKPLGQVLLQQCRLSAAQVQALDVLLVEHLKAHGDDAERSMQALPAASTVPSTLGSIRDDDVQSSVSRLGTASVGEPTRSYGAPAPSNGARFQKRSYHKGGGLGDVYFAEDTELHREVALKEIKPKHADDPVARARFIVEAEITGGLEHPGIVPVYGLGTYLDGRPHYAMRFIRGDDLKKAIERFHTAEKPDRDAGERSLEFRQLLRRFIDVCNAVGYAHSRGVVHRDLKPANVMLGKFGETLVIDWGLAKTGLEPKRRTQDVAPEPILKPQSGSNVYHTQAGTAPGTVPYMSPEQARGDELTPASDIYSLGSTLYKLLTNQAPYAANDPHELLAKVQHGLFASPRAMMPDTPAGLDAVCRKAMSLKPEARYATALDLAADIEHWLADEPVSAYGEPLTARIGRWSRRHRSAVVGTVVFLVVAVVALSVSTGLIWAEQRETAKQMRIAEENYKMTREQLSDTISLVESSEVTLASSAPFHTLRRDILTRAARSCRTFLDKQPTDPERRVWAAQVFRYSANFHRFSGEIDEAGPLYVDSLTLYESLVKQFGDKALYREKLSETLRDHARLQSNAGQLREARNSLRRSVEIAENLLDEDKARIDYRRTLAAAYLGLSGVELDRGIPIESRRNSVRAAELFREALKAPREQQHAYDPILLAAALNNLAVAERESGKVEEARPIHNEAIAVLRSLVDKAKNGEELDVNMADVRHFLAACRLEQCRTWLKTPSRRQNAMKNLASTIREWEELVKERPGIPIYQQSLGTAYRELGKTVIEDKRFEDARVHLEKSRRLLQQVVDRSPKSPAARAEIGRTYLELGRVSLKTEDPGAALAWFGKAEQELNKACSQSPDNVADRRSLNEVPKVVGATP